MAKAVKRFTKSADEAFAGEIPKGRLVSTKELPAVFRAYVYMHTAQDAIEFIEKFMKVKFDDKLHSKVMVTFGWMCHLKMTGCTFESDMETRFNELKAQHLDYVQVKASNVVSISTRSSIENDYIANLEVEIDLLFSGKSEVKSFADYISGKSISKANLDRIHKYYEPLLIEIENKENDVQIKEAYAFLKKDVKANIIAKLKELLEACTSEVENKIRVRKPRKKKAVPIAKIVANVKYKKFDKELNLNSMPPEKVIGYTACVLYDAKYRTVKILYAEKDTKFTFKGSTLLNVDIEKSVQKKLRKPNEMLGKFMKVGRREVAKNFEDIKTTESKVTSGRFNEEIMIISVL